jgi:hypothetical protein
MFRGGAAGQELLVRVMEGLERGCDFLEINAHMIGLFSLFES